MNHYVKLCFINLNRVKVYPKCLKKLKKDVTIFVYAD